MPGILMSEMCSNFIIKGCNKEAQYYIDRHTPGHGKRDGWYVLIRDKYDFISIKQMSVCDEQHINQAMIRDLQNTKLMP